MRPLRLLPLATLLLVGRAAAADPRDLALDATFGDLVRAARALDARGAGRSGTGCLLRPGAREIRLEAALQPGLRPLPEPLADIDEVAGADGHASLAALGTLIGPRDRALLLVPLVASSRALGGERLPLFLLTDRGTYFATIDAHPALPALPARLLDAAERTRLAAELAPQAAGIVVAAEPGVPLKALVALLDLFQGHPGELLLAAPVAPAEARRLAAAAVGGLGQKPRRQAAICRDPTARGVGAVLAIGRDAPPASARGAALGGLLGSGTGAAGFGSGGLGVRQLSPPRRTITTPRAARIA